MLSLDKAKELLGQTKRGYRHSPEKFLEYFTDAQELLEKGWCQGAYARSRKGYRLESGKSKHAASWCAQGALERATPEWAQMKIAKAMLVWALGIENGRWTIASLNDGPNKAQARESILRGYTDVRMALQQLCR